MKQGTTYPITLTLKGVDLRTAEWVIVSLKPGGCTALEFDRDHMSLASDGTDTTIVIHLSQAQSVGLQTTRVVVDCNWMMDGIRGGAIPADFIVDYTLLGRVIDNA